MNQDPISEKSSSRHRQIKPRLNQPLITSSQRCSLLLQQLDVGSHQTDNNTKDETDEEFGSPETDFFCSILQHQSRIYQDQEYFIKILSKTMITGFIM